MDADAHSPTPEELMQYLDGEGTGASRDAIAAHLASCPACQALAGAHHALARDLAAWQVDAAPETLWPETNAPARRWRMRQWALGGGLSAAAAALLFVAYAWGALRTRNDPAREIAESVARTQARGGVVRSVLGGLPGSPPAPPPPTMSASEPAAPVPAAPSAPAAQMNVAAVPGRSLIRSATLQLVSADFASVRGAVERIVEEATGFADQMSVSADPGAPRVLRATLRVPGYRLTETLGRLRALGQVTVDQQHAEDVTDQLVDLDARRRNSRATEQRLLDLLNNRTGKLTDVLEVEQQLTRVRLDIERLDAEKSNMERRVAYAAIDLTISEARKAGLEPGPLPLLTQLRLAAADGLQTVVNTVVGVTLFALRAGPTLLLWGLAAAALWIAARRAIGRARIARSRAWE